MSEKTKKNGKSGETKRTRTSPTTKKSIRDRILENCEIMKKEASSKGEVIVYGDRQFNMNRKFAELTDNDCKKIFYDPEIGLGNYVRRVEKERKKGMIVAKRRRISIDSDPKSCECGCGQIVRRGSKFLPGHDMKLKSVLMKAAKAGDRKAQKELTARGWIRS